LPYGITSIPATPVNIIIPTSTPTPPTTPQITPPTTPQITPPTTPQITPPTTNALPTNPAPSGGLNLNWSTSYHRGLLQGLSTFWQGDKITVGWDKKIIKGPVRADVVLASNNTVVLSTVLNSNSSNYVWNIPKTQAYGKYYIRISDTSNSQVSAKSYEFYVKPNIVLVDVRVNKDKPVVRGVPFTVEYQLKNIENVNVYLIKGADYTSKTILIRNSPSKYTIPTTVEAGSNYMIMVEDARFSTYSSLYPEMGHSTTIISLL
jgi:hypothetical protein